MNSYNHYALGAVVGFFYRRLAGIAPAAPGFRRIAIRPIWLPKVGKVSAPYLATLDGPPRYADVGDKVRALVDVRPDRLVWAANWPHPGHTGADAKPEEADLLDAMPQLGRAHV